MTTISSITGTTPPPVTAGSAPRAPVVASSELAKLESQLSDWVNCASSETSAGKAKISEISDKIEAAKDQIKKVDDQKAQAQHLSQGPEQSTTAEQRLRFDGLGAVLNTRA